MTTIRKSERNICVPDTCSLLFSGQIKLHHKEVLEWLLERYEVYIGPEVKEECFRQIDTKKAEVVNPQKFKNYILQRVIQETEYRRCLQYFTDYCEKNDVSAFSKQHPGEMECLALSLYLNMRLSKPIVLLTDDFPAIKAFSGIIEDQKFAIQMCIPDVIINIFKTELNVDENETRASLLDYYHIMKQAVREEMFKRRFEKSCRNVWSQKCASVCVTQPI